MCGITGIFAFNPIGRIHLIHLEAATSALSKRGPDAHKTWFDEKVGLGHRRLSIIDTSEQANQPFADVSGRYQLVFNGEIYNYREIRNDLTIAGHSFRTESDTEVLLTAYIQWGEKCLNRLNGFFAFAIYDTKTGVLFIARDRFGIKPLYYTQDDDKVLFASEMKALVSFGIKKELDPLGLHLYFQHTYIPAPHSIFKGVKKLLPGHFMKISQKETVIERYYEIPFEENSDQEISVAKGNLVEAMRKSVSRRLVADVPLGAFLSGGIDSSIIVALACEQVTGFKTFSIGFKDNAFFDETHFARLVADKYKTDHHEISLSNDDLLNEVQSVLDYLDEPFADSSALPVYLLSKYTRNHVKVALSGDGADEIFSGYNKHSAWLMSQEKSAKNQFISRFSPLWKVLPKSRGSYLTDKARQLDRYATMLRLSAEARYWFLASFTHEKAVRNLLKPSYRLDEGKLNSFHDSYKPFSKGSLSESLYRDTHLVLEGDMLAKVDRMSMANGLEVRVPFLDPEVVKQAFEMPDRFKTVGNQRKIVLREAFRNYLPEELYTRAKHGFEVPLLPWFRNELRSELMEKVFNKTLIENQGIFEWEEVAKLRKKMDSWNPEDVHVQIWSLLVFQNWYRKYFLNT